MSLEEKLAIFGENLHPLPFKVLPPFGSQSPPLSLWKLTTHDPQH